MEIDYTSTIPNGYPLKKRQENQQRYVLFMLSVVIGISAPVGGIKTSSDYMVSYTMVSYTKL